jgi:hypothetical protein
MGSQGYIPQMPDFALCLYVPFFRNCYENQHFMNEYLSFKE